MVMLKSKVFLRACVFLLAVFVGAMCVMNPVLALKEEQYNRYAQNSIYFYNPDKECIPKEGGGDDGSGGGGGELPSGNSRAEKIWKYIVELGISGISDKAEVIAGIVGNMWTETGGTFNPFIQNSGGCTGLIQWCKGNWNNGFFAYMKKKGLDKYYYKGTEPNIDESIIKDGIVAELDFLLKDGTGGVTADSYKSSLGVPSVKKGDKGARAYADLFLVKVERGYDDKKKYTGTGPIEDPGVAAVADHTFYQGAEDRRDRAESLYRQYKDLVGEGGDDEDEGDDEDDDEEDNDEECKEEDEEEDDDAEEPEAGNLADYVKKWAWPDYHSPPYMARMPAYAEYMDKVATYHPCSGVDCGAFVANIIKASGWDTSYAQGSTSVQKTWLAANWSEVKDTSKLKLGDVGIKSGHVILYVGNIPGFNSKTASASDCRGVHKRAPTAGSPNENLNKYTWYRKK